MTWNYCNFPEPNLDPPEYDGPLEDGVTEEELDQEVHDLCVASQKLWPHASLDDIRDSGSLSYEDWTGDWDDNDGPIPTRECLAPFFESLKNVQEAREKLDAWEEPESWECRCHKRTCPYCGDY